MTIPTLHTLQVIIKSILYAGLFWEGYKLIKFIKNHRLLHSGVVGRLKLLSYIFSILLVVKITFGIITLKIIDAGNLGHETDAYTNGFLAGQVAGQYARTVFQNIDLMIAVGFNWLLSLVIQKAILLKQEQEFTI
jgi:hypothetical protein